MADEATTTRRVPLKAFAKDERVMVRERIDPDTVARYVEATDLPPIVAFEVDGHLIVTDGYHRLLAARDRGDKDIATEVRTGTIEDAIEHASLANVRHGRPLSRDERDAAIIRLYRLPKRMAGSGNAIIEGWSQTRLGDAFGLTSAAVRQIIRASEVIEAMGSGSTTKIPTRVATAIGAGPREAWDDLAGRYARGELRDQIEVVAAARVAREAADPSKPAPASAHEVMARVAARAADRAAAAALLIPTDEENEIGAEADAMVKAEAWFFYWVADAERFVRYTTEWLETTSFDNRDPESIAEIRAAAMAAADAANQVLGATSADQIVAGVSADPS